MSSKINRIVEQILLDHWDGLLPVNVVAIAEARGHGVVGRALGAISGEVCLAEEGRYVITYNDRDRLVRQRFTIAHELGHIELEHLQGRERCLRDPRENYSIDNYDPIERDANRFAAALLMPAGAVRSAIYDMKNPTLRRMAELFTVSRLAMQIRLTQLGIIPAGV